MLTIYFYMALFGGTVTILLTILSLFGANAEETSGDLESLDDVHEPGEDSSLFFKLLSFRALVAGVTFFGLGGGLVSAAGMGTTIAMQGAAVFSIAGMLFVVWMMDAMSTLQQNKSFSPIETLGAIGQVYIPIPGKRSGQGKVTVFLRNRTVELEAVTEGEPLLTGETVTVTDVEGELVTVRRAPAP